MSTSKDIIVKDSCILFDLLDLELMDHFFKLPITVHTTVQVIGEVEDPEQLISVNNHISAGRLKVDGNGTYDDINVHLQSCPGLSFTDGSVIELALRLQGMVLSADRSLRRHSESQQLTVRGVLWLIEEMHLKQIITTELAVEKLKLYPQINQRAPKLEISALIKKLESLQV